MLMVKACYNGGQINALALRATAESVADSVTELKENETDVAQPTIHPSAHLLQEKVWTLNLERAQKYVLLALTRLSIDGVVELPSGSFSIEHLTGISRRAVGSTIKKLIKANILIVERAASRDRYYRFVAPIYRIDLTACEESRPYRHALKNPTKTRRQLIEKHDATCAYCKRVGTGWADPDGESWQVDRVTPRAKGGGYEPENIVLACGMCNRRKNKK